MTNNKTIVDHSEKVDSYTPEEEEEIWTRGRSFGYMMQAIEETIFNDMFPEANDEFKDLFLESAGNA